MMQFCDVLSLVSAVGLFVVFPLKWKPLFVMTVLTFLFVTFVALGALISWLMNLLGDRVVNLGANGRMMMLVVFVLCSNRMC